MQTRQSIAIFHLLIFVSILHTLIPRVQSRECPLLLPLNEPTTQRSLDPFRGNLSAANEINPRIIWGSDISPTLLPYMAALFISIRGSDSFICTAIVVAPRLLITAAHCIVGLNDGTTFVPFDVADYIVAYFGAEKTSTKSATKRNIISRVPHPNYDFDDFSTYEYDIAYLNLDEDVPDGNKFMKVNSNFSNPVPGSAVRNIGYGVQRYYSNQNVYSGYDNEDDTAQQVDFPVVNYTYCDHMWKKLQEGVPDDVTVVVSRNFHICAGYLNGGCSSWYVFLLSLHVIHSLSNVLPKELHSVTEC